MVYDNIANSREAVSFLFTGFFRGFAHLEKHWAATGLIERLEPVEQWFWLRDGLFGDWEYNAGANPGTMRGEAVDPSDFIIHECAALDRILSVLYLRKNLFQRDWDYYLAVYGITDILPVIPHRCRPSVSAGAYWSLGMQVTSAPSRPIVPQVSCLPCSKAVLCLPASVLWYLPAVPRVKNTKIRAIKILCNHEDRGVFI